MRSFTKTVSSFKFQVSSGSRKKPHHGGTERTEKVQIRDLNFHYRLGGRTCCVYSISILFGLLLRLLIRCQLERQRKIKTSPCPPCLRGELTLLFFGKDSQIVPCHFLGLRDTENPEHGRSNVLQRAIGTQGEAARVALELSRRDRMFGHYDERHGIRGVRRLRTARGRIDHLLGIAVVGSDDHGSAALTECRVDLAQAAVNGL